MEQRDVDRILREIRVVQACVHGIAKNLEGDSLPDEASYQKSIRALVGFPLVMGWMQDAGLTSYEISLAREGNLAGTFILNSLIEGLKAGVAVATRAIREESDTSIEAVNAWLAAEELVKATGAKAAWEKKPVATQLRRTFQERTKLYEARAEALLADDSADVDVEEAERQAAFLRGRAAEAKEFSDVILKTLEGEEIKPPPT